MNPKPVKKEFNLFYAVLVAAILVTAGLLVPLLIIESFDPTFIWFRPNFIINEQLFFNLNA